jgi:cytochrome c biogenesis protein CcmG/thiol:disulfide interchange protein DsbE
VEVAAAARRGRLAKEELRMNRGLRLIPIILLLFLVSGLVWRLIKPADPAIPSQLVERPVPRFDLAAAVPGKPGLNSSGLATGEPRLLNIFASWCVPCVGEAPVLSELRRRGAKIDAIAVRDRPEAIEAFLREHGDPYDRLGADPRSNAQMALGSSGVPETFVVDGRGVIRHQYIGPLTAANLPGVLQQLKDVR